MDNDLVSAVSRVCEAIRRHATVCQTDPGNAVNVVREGEALREAVLEYERVLGATTGWSNPVRHLGPLPMFADEQIEGPTSRGGDDSSDVTPRAKVSVEIDIKYQLKVEDADALLRFVSGRWGEEVWEIPLAVELLLKSDSWDPLRYPPGLLELVCVNVAISDVSSP